MRGIPVPSVVALDFSPPSERAIGLEGQGPAVVDISAFRERELSKEARRNHLTDGEHRSPEAAIFGQHINLARFFHGIDEVPTLLDRHGGGHFAEHVLPCPKGIHRHHGVPLHGRSDKHRLQVIAL